MVKPRQSRAGATATDSPRALVKWLDGREAGTYFDNLDPEWILQFNAASPVFPETYAVEWRQLPRPRSGWPVYSALLLDVSSDRDYLKDKTLRLEKEDQAAADPNGPRPSSSPQNLVDVNSDSFRQLLLSLRTPAGVDSSPRTTRDSPNLRRPEPFGEEKVKVGKSLWVSSIIYHQAKNASSPGRMIRPLLRQAFSRRRLIRSSYAGQKRSKGEEVVTKPGLKRYQKMADIHGFVMQKYPYISQASFGAIVNSFLGPKPNQIHQMEYVEESASDEEDDEDNYGL